MHRLRCFRWLIVLAVFTISVALVPAAQADDLLPPPWRLIDPYTTVQGWEFAGLPIADLVANDPVWGVGGVPGAVVGDTPTPLGPNPVAVPLAGIVPDPAGWRGDLGGGTIRLFVPNWEDDYFVKNARIQIKYIPSPGGDTPGWAGAVARKPGEPDYSLADLNSFGLNLITGTELINPFPDFKVTDVWFNNFFGTGNNWFDAPWIDPQWYNPWWETFLINVPNNVVVQQIVLDTWSHTVPTEIPEPGTYALFGLGALVLIGWSRRRKQVA